MQSAHTFDSVSVPTPVVARQRLCELSLLVQIRMGWKRANKAIAYAVRGVV
jgi:hypothetical protein